MPTTDQQILEQYGTISWDKVVFESFPHPSCHRCTLKSHDGNYGNLFFSGVAETEAEALKKLYHDLCYKISVAVQTIEGSKNDSN